MALLNLWILFPSRPIVIGATALVVTATASVYSAVQLRKVVKATGSVVTVKTRRARPEAGVVMEETSSTT
jgi:hypothetical protein